MAATGLRFADYRRRGLAARRKTDADGGGWRGWRRRDWRGRRAIRRNERRPRAEGTGRGADLANRGRLLRRIACPVARTPAVCRDRAGRLSNLLRSWRALSRLAQADFNCG